MYGLPDIPLYWFASVVSAFIYNCNHWELLCGVALLLLAWRGWLPVPENWVCFVKRLAGSWWAYVVVALAPVTFRLALLPWKPVPLPYVPDEFSHLLVAQTLVAGRLANPPHPMWTFFEAIHVLQQPAYASMYLPGQGIFLALGQVLFHDYYAGVLLSCACLCAALLWALRGWLSPHWAFVGTGLIIGKTLWNGAASGYWINSFWGGAVPAMAGALVIGAVGHFNQTKPNWAAGAAGGLGLVFLAITRPLEGAVLGASAIALLLWRNWTFRVLPGLALAALVVAAGAVGIGHFNRAVTGSASQLPYFVNQQTYGWPMTAVWMKPEAKALRHSKLADYWDWERSEHDQIDNVIGQVLFAPLKTSRQWHHYVGLLLTLPLMAGLGAILRNKAILPLALIALAGLAVVITEQSSFPHYYSPFTVCIAILLAECCRIWANRSGLIAKPYLFWLPVAFAVCAILRTQAAPIVRAEQLGQRAGWCCTFEFGQGRDRVLKALKAHGGQHVVFVRYTRRNRDFTFDWVYNPPDIDGAQVIFARDQGEEQNRKLMEYYPGRQFWVAWPETYPVVWQSYDQVSFHNGHHSPDLSGIRAAYDLRGLPSARGGNR